MNMNKMFINRMMQAIGRMVAYCCQWPTWAGVICLSAGIFSSSSVLATQVEYWNAAAVSDALGPRQAVPWNRSVITYPAAGKANLGANIVFPNVSSMLWQGDDPKMTMENAKFRLVSKGKIFDALQVSSGTYNCKIKASFKDNRPGTAEKRFSLDMMNNAGLNQTEYESLEVNNGDTKVDEDVKNAALQDFKFDVSCSGDNFSWQRHPDQKIKFDTSPNGDLIGFQVKTSSENDFVVWQRPLGSLPEIKDPTIILQPPNCYIPIAYGRKFSFGEVLQIDGYQKGSQRKLKDMNFSMQVICLVTEEENTGGTVIVVASSQNIMPGTQNQMLQVIHNTEADSKETDHKALGVKLELSSVNVEGPFESTPVSFSADIDPKFSCTGDNVVVGKNKTTKSMNKQITFANGSSDADTGGFVCLQVDNPSFSTTPSEKPKQQSTKFYLHFTGSLWQIQKLEPSNYGYFQTSFDMTLVRP
uniref:hypothetical protein n=1 Tax=Photorhabdus sp. RM322S TaxID=3342825 RepID=UPI0036DD22AE